MTFYLDYPWANHLVALGVYGLVLAYFGFRRRWRDELERCFVLYLVLALLGDLTYLLSQAASLWAGLIVFAHLSLYIATALPMFFYLLARVFMTVERKPWIFGVGIGLLAALIAIDLGQFSISVDATVIPSSHIILVLRALIWSIYNGLTIMTGTVEYRQAFSPLHRNRLAYFALASPFLFADGALDMLFGLPARQLAVACQLVGVTTIAYATMQHHLADLRTLLRQAIYFFVITAFTIVVYALVIGAVLTFLNRTDPVGALSGVVIAGVGLALVYQPLRDVLQRAFQTALFGQPYDVKTIVQEFSQRLSARVELDELAQEGRVLLEKAMGARDAALMLVSHSETSYSLRLVPPREEVPEAIELESISSIITVLEMQAAPLLQYDIDRLPEYVDISFDTRQALKKLGGEVYVPVLSGAVLIGVWVVGPKLSGDRYTNTDLVLLTTLAGQSAVALENARLLMDLREQMARMRSMRDYLDSTMASIATGVITLDQHDRIISFNRAAESIFRVAPAKALGKTYQSVLPPFDGPQLALMLARIWGQIDQHFVRDATTIVEGRGQVHLSIRLSAMRRDDALVGVAMVIEDLTDLARLERERRAQEEETQRVRNTFERYVAPSVVEELLTDPNRVALGGERQLVTILFADIHGFTSLSEQMAPEELIKVLNGYLSLAAQTILHYEGTLDKFLGDGVMAIFNAPMSQPDHALRAASAALALQREVAAYAPKLPGSQRLGFRIGLHTGEAVVGNIGTHELMNYTAVGDTVNVAKRLQENAEDGQILMSRNTYTLIENRVAVRPCATIPVKGRVAPVEVFELTSVWEGYIS